MLRLLLIAPDRARSFDQCEIDRGGATPNGGFVFEQRDGGTAIASTSWLKVVRPQEGQLATAMPFVAMPEIPHGALKPLLAPSKDPLITYFLVWVPSALRNPRTANAGQILIRRFRESVGGR